MGVAVEVRDLSFSFGNSGSTVGHRLEDVSFSVAEGEVCCLLGPNGAGKTTMLRCLLGLLTPHAGTIRVHGKQVGQLSKRQLARRVAYVPQSTSTPFPFTTLDMAVMGRTPHIATTTSPSEADRRAAQAVLEQLGIGRLTDRPFSVLSGGERRLALMARAVVQDAPVLMLDEPTSALDFGNEARVLEVICELAEAGHTVLMTTHQPSHALLCADQAVLFRDGRIVADGPADRVVTGTELSELYGIEVRVLTSELEDRPGRSVFACAPVVGGRAPQTAGTASIT
jgi:iron complex transport system ATP-binding protein